MNISNLNISKPYFKGINNAVQNGVTANNNADQACSSVTNPLQTSPVNIKTPVSYTKLGDLQVSGTDKQAALYKLSNGQKIVILPKEGPTVIKSYFNVGSLNEPDNLRGISHYIEHNLFNGTNNLGPGEFFKKISDMGAYTNAGTSLEQTNYYIKSSLLEDNYLEEIIKLHSDQIQHPLFAEKQLIKEKGPVTSEISMYSDDPKSAGMNLMLKNLFNIQSSSSDLVAGRIANINSINREDVLNYYNTWYTPDNTITVITGETSPDEIIELAAKYFNKPPSDLNSSRKYENLTPANKPIRTDIKMPKASLSSITMGFAGPENNNTKDKVIFDTLNSLLTGVKSSKLNQELEKHQLSAYSSILRISNKPDDKQAIIFGADVSDEKSDLTLKILFEHISKLCSNPPSPEELNIAKEKIKFNHSEYLETSEGLNSFIGDSLLNNDANYMKNYVSILDSITPEDISNFAKKYLDLNKVSISVVHPDKVSNEQIMNNYNNTNFPAKTTPSFKGSFSSSITDNLHSDVKLYTLSNNIKTAVNPSDSDMISYNINFKLPQYLNASKAEIMILETMLNRGTALKDTKNFDYEQDKDNISMGYGVSPDGLYVSAHLPSEKLSKALDMTNEVLNTPRFTRENFEWAKKLVKEAYDNIGKDPYDKLMSEFFPNIKHFEGREKAQKEIDSISLDKIINIYQNIIDNSCGSAVITVPKEAIYTGDIFNTYLSSHIKTLKPFNAQTINTYTNDNKQKKIFTESEKRNQAEIVQGYKFKLSGNIEDKAKFLILNTVLGGGSSSRLFNDLRESQKLAYRVYSGFKSVGNTGMINLSIMTTTDDASDPNSSPENIQKSLWGFDKHVNKLKNELISEEELKKTKLLIKNNILECLETSKDKTNDLTYAIDSLYGINETKKFLEALDKVTAQDIKNAAGYAFANEPVISVVASENTLKQCKLP